MVFEGCSLGSGGMYLNMIFGAIIFAFIFWGVYYLFIQNKEKKRRRK